MSQDLLQRHIETLMALEEVLGSIDPYHWTWKPDAETWCAAEIFDHVGKIGLLYSFPKLEACLMGKGEPQRERTFLGWCLLNGPWLAGIFRHRRTFPPELVPQMITQPQALAVLQELRRRAEAFAPRVAKAGASLRVEHVRLGWLHARDWYAFAEIHTRHHLKGQLRRLMAMPGFQTVPEAVKG
jgi:hypothetical protein